MENNPGQGRVKTPILRNRAPISSNADPPLVDYLFDGESNGATGNFVCSAVSKIWANANFENSVFWSSALVAPVRSVSACAALLFLCMLG